MSGCISILYDGATAKAKPGKKAPHFLIVLLPRKNASCKSTLVSGTLSLLVDEEGRLKEVWEEKADEREEMSKRGKEEGVREPTYAYLGCWVHSFHSVSFLP